MTRIKLFAMDVDGTMTDGKIYMGSDGELFKAFDIHDGYAVHEMLPARGIKTAIITGRESKIVENRAKELEIDFVMQDIKDKASAITELQSRLRIKKNETAYIGDDIIDLEAMRCCGLSGCPADAIAEVKNYCDFVSALPGGRGAVRDFAEWIVRMQEKDNEQRNSNEA